MSENNFQKKTREKHILRRRKLVFCRWYSYLPVRRQRPRNWARRTPSGSRNERKTMERGRVRPTPQQTQLIVEVSLQFSFMFPSPPARVHVQRSTISNSKLAVSNHFRTKICFTFFSPTLASFALPGRCATTGAGSLSDWNMPIKKT